MFFVDHDTPGVRVVRVPRYSHTYADQHPIVAFEDVRVPASNLSGSEGDGLAFTYEWFRYERLMIAARCCGAAERLIEEATAFAKERVQFGQPDHREPGDPAHARGLADRALGGAAHDVPARREHRRRRST